MSSLATPPTFAGWYADTETGGTKYWDGARWTGDTRPPRRAFAAAARHQHEGWSAVALGVPFILMSLFAGKLNDGSVPTAGLFLALFLGGAALLMVGVFLLRGQGPTTEAVEARLAAERKAAKKKRRAANLAGIASSLGARPSAPAASDEAARIGALADPETSRSLQTLQSLLYTRTITDKEFQAAKRMLLGDQAFTESLAQIEKLAELHQAGILGDIEFAAAKAKSLGLA